MAQSRYITNQIRKIENILKDFEIVKVDKDRPNNNGYGYLPNRLNRHYLEDGTYLTEGLCFDAAKAADMPFVTHCDANGKVIKRLLE